MCDTRHPQLMILNSVEIKTVCYLWIVGVSVDLWEKHNMKYFPKHSHLSDVFKRTKQSNQNQRWAKHSQTWWLFGAGGRGKMTISWTIWGREKSELKSLGKAECDLHIYFGWPQNSPASWKNNRNTHIINSGLILQVKWLLLQLYDTITGWRHKTVQLYIIKWLNGTKKNHFNFFFCKISFYYYAAI